MRFRPTFLATAVLLASGLSTASAQSGGCGCSGGGSYTASGPSQAVATQGYFVNGATAPAPAMAAQVAAPRMMNAPATTAGYGYEQAQYAPALGANSPSSYPGYVASPTYSRSMTYPSYTRGYGRLFRRR